VAGRGENFNGFGERMMFFREFALKRGEINREINAGLDDRSQFL
jgi:hypothetical protein